jgi:hypothetical protein
MIRTLADLLNALISKETARLEECSSELSHAGLIGDMYEGLTKDILNRSLFEQHDIRVVDGQIRGGTYLAAKCAVVTTPLLSRLGWRAMAFAL